jgi:bifunctional DNase/RNase
MQVKSLRPGPHARHAVLETSAQDRAIAFAIPMNEADRLAAVLGLTRVCSPVCDRVLSVTRRLDAAIRHALIDATGDRITAALALRHQAEEMTLRCHPADAVTLAVRAKAPIYATAAALATGCGGGPRGLDAPAGGVARWLATVRPDDFRIPDISVDPE